MSGKKLKNSFMESILGGLYWIFLFVLTGITISVVFQQILIPNRVPNVFGYKLFIILDGQMEESLKKGDLVITKNQPASSIKAQDFIAFHNKDFLVTIHRVNHVTLAEGKYSYHLHANTSEILDSQVISEDSLEGKLVKIIPYVGWILFMIQIPQVTIDIILIILIIGAIALWIAQKQDERDRKRLENENKV